MHRTIRNTLNPYPVKQFAYLYYNIYQRCARRSNIPDDGFVRIQAMYLFSLSAGGWVLLLQALYLRFVKLSWFSSPPHATGFAIAVYLLTAMLLHRIFITNEVDQKILHRFGHNWYEKSQKKRQVITAAALYMAPYLLLILMAVFFPRQH